MSGTTPPENPLIGPLAQMLRAAKSPLSEYQLIRQLVDDGIWRDDYQGSSLGVYRTHFFVMNALYRLREQFWRESLYLHISPLAIYLEAVAVDQENKSAQSSSESQPAYTAPLAFYYLDWTHLESATEASVEALLEDFWRRWASGGMVPDERTQALAVLGLDAGADDASIRQAYRRLAMQHHPDRGGDPQVFMRIQQAIERLLPR